MPINSCIESRDEGGESKEALVITFTNGAKHQIELLRTHFELENELDVVKLGISLLQRIKETEDKKINGNDKE